ncbi:MAG: nuclear transport factor 2 family protein [Sphingobium sp.]|nr:nuclear transport factor 2 family protein [Sphingobium sp.]
MKGKDAACSMLAVAALCLSGAPSVYAQSATKAPDPSANACQRACLEGWVDKYLAAMRDQNVDPALFARDVKFTENGVQLHLGNEGLWHGMTAVGSYKFYVPDFETQQVAFLGTVRENARGTGADSVVAIALRLKIHDGKITEVEQLASRPDSINSSRGDFPPTGEGMEKMGAPHPVFKEAIPPAERETREELVRDANYYFAGLQRNDGKGYYPFTDDCVRFENGVDVLLGRPGSQNEGKRQTCKGQFETGVKGIVSRIRDRRFVAVDRERGIAFAFGFFDHEQINWTWQLAELFKIEKGKIRRIEAIFHRAPYGLNSGWSTFEQGMSEEPQSIR